MTTDTIRPPCQTADCDAAAATLLRSKRTGTELHLCEECASRYNELGWELIRGDVTLRPEGEA